jgi:aryl-phospho-beta-D-glucosidase BglC (GH1 family)
VASPAIAAKLRRGVNLSHWWWQPDQRDPGKIEKSIGPDDVKLIKGAGLTHVRIPIDPSFFVSPEGKLNDANAARLLRSVKAFNDAGIAAVIDCHPAGTQNKKMLATDSSEGWADELEKFWKAFAPALRQTSPDLVAVELLNEPNGIAEAKEWPAAQERARKAVRAVLPRHTVILTGDDWGSIDGLVRLDAAPDANTVYSIHFYEPHTFTHQQATWGSPMWKEIKNLRYPFDQNNADTTAAATADPKAAASIKRYAKDQWNAAKVQSRLDAAAAWAKEHKAMLYLGEFGAYRAGCDEASRTAWLADVRQAAEKNGIGWCAWDYSGGYAITTRASEKNPRTFDEPAARALGLTVPPAPKKKP